MSVYLPITPVNITMKPILLSAVLLVAVAQAQSPDALKFGIQMQGVNAGTAEMTVIDLPNKNRQVVMTMDLKGPAGNARIRQETIYDGDGMATRKITETVLNKSERTLFTAELNKKEARLTIKRGKQTETKVIPVSPDAPLKNPSTYWFDRTTPKVGEKVVYYAFEINEQAWRLQSVTYMGAETKAVNGKPVKFHRLKVERGAAGTVLTDEKGLPLKMDFGDMVIARDGYAKL